MDRSSTPKLGFEGRHVPLRSCRGLVEFQSPSAAHGLRRDAGLVMKTAFLAPHAPRPCLPVWPCLGNACPRVLPVTTLHDDGLLGRAARRFVKKEKRKKTEDGLYQAVFGRASVKLRPKLSSVHGPPKLGTEGCTEAVPYVKVDCSPVVKRREAYKVLRRTTIHFG